MLHKLPLFTALFMAVHFVLPGQTTGPLLWSQSYQRPGSAGIGTPPLESYTDMKELSSGSIIAVGNAAGLNGVSYSDAMVRKINAGTGSIISENYIDYYGGTRNDVAVKVLVAEPYIYIIGTAEYSVSPYDKDIFIIKKDTSLNTIWSYGYNNTGNPNDMAVDAGLDMFGNIYVLGNTTRTATGADIVLLKLDPNGTALFTKFYSSTGNYTDMAKGMAVELNGICNITGYYTNATLGSRMLALKVWSNGVQLWVKYHDVTSGAIQPDEGLAVSYDPSSNDMFICGKGTNASGNFDWVVVRFAGSDGTKVWNTKYAGSNNSNDAGVKVIYDSGELYTCGYISTSVSGVVSQNIQLRKLKSVNGSAIWTKTYNFLNGASGASVENVTSMILSPAGNIYLGGTVSLPTPSSYDLYHLVLNYNSAGIQQWAHMQSTSSFSSFQGLDVNALVYSGDENAVYAGGFKWSTMSLISYSTLLKLGPTFINAPVAEKSDLITRSIVCYPNPAINELHLKQPATAAGTLFLYDLNGKLLLQNYLPDEDNTIGIGELSPGLYIAKYTGNGISETFRIVKQ